MYSFVPCDMYRYVVMTSGNIDMFQVNDGKIDISDVELRKQLQMTTADLRFADILVKAVTEEENKFLEGTGQSLTTATWHSG